MALCDLDERKPHLLRFSAVVARFLRSARGVDAQIGDNRLCNQKC